MKKLFIVLIIALLSIFSCYVDEYETFHLIYSITSLTEEPVDIEVTYKVGNEYIDEQTQTPFIIEQDIKLNKTQKENFYYYLELQTINKNTLNIQIISNDEKLYDTENIINPVMFGGYIGFGLTSVDIPL